MNNYGNLFDDNLKNGLIDEAKLKKSQCKMSIYYRYAPYGSKLVVLYYADDCVYWYKYE